MVKLEKTIAWKPFSDKHKKYIENAINNQLVVAEGAIRSGKTIDNVIIATMFLETCKDKFHLASGSTIPNAKFNIGVCNGYGLENLFRGRCRWGKYRDNDALFINTQTGEKIVIFAGGGKADSYKKILGNAYGLWIATEINEHYDSDDSRTSFVKVAFGRQLAAEQPFTLWDLNPCNPNHRIYVDYIDKYKDGYSGGYQYEHFTIHDNAALSEAGKKALESKYTPGSIWYQRDILGLRVVAQGAIYKEFTENENYFYVEWDSKQKCFYINGVPKYLEYINVGIDWGGDKSGHAFVATGITRDYEHVIILKGIRIPAKDTDSEAVCDEAAKFAKKTEEDFGFIDNIYADHEIMLINRLRKKTDIPVRLAIKNKISERVRFAELCMAQKRLWITRACENVADFFRSAVYDPKSLKDERLDDGSYDQDSGDAWEYSIERYMNYIIREQIDK